MTTEEQQQSRVDIAGRTRSSADEQLVARCRAGDENAWPELVRRFAPYVYAIAVQGHRLAEHDAEDVFQEVFLRTWERLDDLRSDAAIRPWIAQLARRLSIDRLRAIARERAREEVEELAIEPAREVLEHLDTALKVRDAVERLSTAQRELVRRFFVEGQSHATIAEALGIAEGTVASRVSRVRARLCRDLADEARREAPMLG